MLVTFRLHKVVPRHSGVVTKSWFTDQKENLSLKMLTFAVTVVEMLQRFLTLITEVVPAE